MIDSMMAYRMAYRKMLAITLIRFPLNTILTSSRPGLNQNRAIGRIVSGSSRIAMKANIKRAREDRSLLPL
jgi:hypothetical protein